MPHPLIMIVAALLVLGFIARRALPARTVVQHLEARNELGPSINAVLSTLRLRRPEC